MLGRGLVRLLLGAAVLGSLAYAPLPVVPAQGIGGDPQALAFMQDANQKLADQGFNVAIGQVELFTIGKGRPITRLHQAGYQFVPNDPRRNADGTKIRYLVDSTADTPLRGDTTSGLTHTQTEKEIDAAMNTWEAQNCLQDLVVEKTAVPNGVDPDLFDYFLVGDGHPPSQVRLFRADIVDGGWLPLSTVFGPSTIGVAITAYFTRNGQPTDVNHDGYVDTAFVEIYYNDDFSWAINEQLPKIDVQSVALHESGHAFGLGHFGPPPTAVMNDFYGGPRQSLFPTDLAGLCTLWPSWPH